MTSKGQKGLALGASVLVNGGFLLAVAGLAPQPSPPPVEMPAFEVALETFPSLSESTSQKVQTHKRASPSAEMQSSVQPLQTAVLPLQPSSSAPPAEPRPSPQTAQPSGQSEPVTATRWLAEVAAAAAAPSAPPGLAGTSRQSAAQGQPSAAYAARLRHHIEQFKLYPPQARRRRVEGEVTLSFQIDRKGRVLSSRIERGSGSADIDRAAFAMLNDAQPLPRPPDSMAGEVLSLSLTTRFSLTD